MAKVTNNTDRGVVLRGLRVLPKSSKVVDRDGHIHDEMPDEIAYCNQAKRLADAGTLTLSGYKPRMLRTAKVQENAPLKDKPLMPALSKVTVTGSKISEQVEDDKSKKKSGKK